MEMVKHIESRHHASIHEYPCSKKPTVCNQKVRAAEVRGEQISHPLGSRALLIQPHLEAMGGSMFWKSE